MNLRDVCVFVLTALGFCNHASAQTDFNEVRYTPRATVFCLNAPTAAQGNLKKPKAVLRLYRQGSGGEAYETLRMHKSAANRWTASVKGDLKGTFYTFDVGLGETPGMFATAVGVNGRRAAVVDLQATNPAEGFHDECLPRLASPADLMIYEMHWRDLTVDSLSPVNNPALKGKFLALTQPAMIHYLQQLGVNAVHILPSFDFGSIDESTPSKLQYNWGYDPVNYNVPEGSYSTNATDPLTRIREFKLMVSALHKAGIRVILDVVYNHTFDLDHSNFTLTGNKYNFYRFTPDGKPGNGSGCGNETASEKPMMRSYMLQSVKYWMQQYHIDGFRFDLMGVHDIHTMNLIEQEVKQLNPQAFVYGEGWSAGACQLPDSVRALKANVRHLPGVAAFCDDMRDALRGPFNDDTKGAFLAGKPGSEQSIMAGIVGMTAHPQIDYTKVNYSSKPWALQPTQCINYVSCHDDMCLVDRLRASIPHIADSDVIKLTELAHTAVILSQGVPFMLSGEELLRTKQGVHNSFNSPDRINAIAWKNYSKYKEVYDYFAALVQLRHEHPLFRLGSVAEVSHRLHFLEPQSCVVGFSISNASSPLQGESWQKAWVLLNANNAPAEVKLPEGTYTVIGRQGIINANGLGTMAGGTVRVAPRSALILKQ